MHFWISSPWNEVSKSSVFSDFKHWKHCVQKAKTYRKTLLFKKKPCPCELGLTPPQILLGRATVAEADCSCSRRCSRVHRLHHGTFRQRPRSAFREYAPGPFFFFEGSEPQLHSKYNTHVQILKLQHNQGENINNSTQTMKRKKINTIWASQQRHQADVTLRLWDAPGGMCSCVEDGTKQHLTLQVTETRLMESRDERPREPRQNRPSNQLT